MHFSSAILVASALSAAAATSLTAGQLKSFNALDKIMGRQTRFCTPVSTPSCALSCGEGYVTCVSWPTCYNPGRGDTCCSNGSYCRTGYYCVDVGCCPNGSTLEECGATVTLSVILPPVVSATSSLPSYPSSSSTTTTTSSYSSSTSSSTTTTSSSSSSSSTTTTTSSSTTTRASNGTTTTTAPPIDFTGAAQSVAVGAAQVIIGGLALLMAL